MTARINDGLTKQQRRARRLAELRCSADDCQRAPAAFNPQLCSGHRTRLWRTGSLDPSPTSVKRQELRALWSRVSSPEALEPGECWVFPGATVNTGYGSVARNGEFLAHRAAWVQVHGPIPDRLHVLHRCDNPPCLRPSHLFLGTARDNSDDKFGKGRNWAGDGRPDGRIRLSDDAVEEIRRLLAEGRRQAEIAALFGVRPNHISLIKRGKRRTTPTGVTPRKPVAA